MRLTIVTPAFNEASNLPALYQRVADAMHALDVEWEWVIVDDHSRDETFAVVELLATRDARVRGIRLARNSGSHVAIACGLHHASGDAAVIMAADLQDPPETLGAMLHEWRAGAHVVWAARRTRPGERAHAGFASLYYWVMRRMAATRDMPSRGADFFLADRLVIDAFAAYSERNISVLALVTSLGFRQASIEYDKQSRASGRSGWTLTKKAKLVIDSITAFSAFPIRLCTYAGLVLLAVALVGIVLSLLALPALGAGILFVLAVMFGLTGLQLLALGVVGEYVWRALEESRRRPLYLVEATAGVAPPALVRSPAAAQPSIR